VQVGWSPRSGSRKACRPRRSAALTCQPPPKVEDHLYMLPAARPSWMLEAEYSECHRSPEQGPNPAIPCSSIPSDRVNAGDWKTKLSRSCERTDQDRSLCLPNVCPERPGRYNRGVQVAVRILRRLRTHDAAQSFHNGRPWRRAGAPPLHATRGSLQILVVADVQREAVREPH
jgi:hypothetical protein